MTPGESEYAVEGDLQGYCEAADKETLWDNPRRHALLDYLIEYTKP